MSALRSGWQFGVLLAARVLQGMGGALMLPATVAMVSSAFSKAGRGCALGTVGGIAAVAGAPRPHCWRSPKSAISWRSVLLINVPLVVLTVIFTLHSVPPDPRLSGRVDVDLGGALLLWVALVGVVFGLAQTQV